MSAAEHIADLLAPWAQVDIRRMFGGSGIYHDGTIFGLIDEEIVYFKTNEATRADFEAAGSEPFSFPRVDKDGSVKTMIMTAYWRVPEAVLEDNETLIRWAQTAFQTARQKPAKAKPKKTKNTKQFSEFSDKAKRALASIGIFDEAQLRAEGAVATYKKLKARYPKAMTLNRLWGLYAFVNDMDVKAVSPDIKAHLKDLLEAETD